MSQREPTAAMRNEPLVAIAIELGRMRMLKEYELGVIIGVGTNDFYHLADGNTGKVIWREDEGFVEPGEEENA